MFNYFLQGIVVGLAYLAPIGMQNIYLINTAAQETRKKTLVVAFIIIFFDISLALACFFGIGMLINTWPVLQGIILLFGSVLVICIGLALIRSLPQISEEEGGAAGSSLVNIIWICFAIAWLNPQAIIDGSLLLGGIYASLPRGMSIYFIFGVCISSCLWFLSLAAITAQFRHKLDTAVLRGINIVCGLIIVFYGIKLGFSFLQLVR
jgi:L-lysine exporter family protein LysE/ArgO